MSVPFQKSLQKLFGIGFQFTNESAKSKLSYFTEISKTKFVLNKTIFEYHQILLFTLTHAENHTILQKAESELKRLTMFIKKHANQELFADSGLPFTTMLTRFTQDAFTDLKNNKDVSIQLESLNNDSFNLNSFLNITMPSILKEYTTAEMCNEDLLETLRVHPNRVFEYLLNEINHFKSPPLVKDLLWQSLQSFFYIKGIHQNYSKSYNRLLLQNYYYHQEILKDFDHFKLIRQKIPEPAKLSDTEKNKIAFIIRNSMPLAMREIDTITYLDINTLRVFHLERGLSLALYTARPERQLPMQSFVGYSLFKNAYPVSYGGSWIFGETSLFGLNILEEFRGGESKYLMTQILRVYIQLYKISYYEIEPFQFGNYEALQTGAFWFYYKYGFRSKNNDVNRLALKEAQKIKNNRQYKTPINTLEKLSEYNIVLKLKNDKAVHRDDIIGKINAMIAKKYKGNSFQAIEEAKKYFLKNFSTKRSFTPIQERVLEEVALWAFTHKIEDSARLNMLYKIIFTKSENTIHYNKLVLKVIALS